MMQETKQLIEAALDVVANWSGGDLAGAVNALEEAADIALNALKHERKARLRAAIETLENLPFVELAETLPIYEDILNDAASDAANAASSAGEVLCSIEDAEKAEREEGANHV